MICPSTQCCIVPIKHQVDCLMPPHAHLQNNSAVLKELLSESGARQACKAVNKAGCTAPDLAMQRGFKEIIQLISDALGPASLTDRHVKPSKVTAPAC
jgi:hypothetical protein